VLIAICTPLHSIVAETPDQLLAVAIDDLVSAMPSHEDGDDAVAVFFVKEASSSPWDVFALASIDQVLIAFMCAGTRHIEALATPAEFSTAVHCCSSG